MIQATIHAVSYIVMLTAAFRLATASETESVNVLVVLVAAIVCGASGVREAN
jgi:hypothetical protein